MSCAFTLLQSPVGTLTLVARGECLAAVLWEQERENRVRLGALHRDDQHPTLRETARQLGEYFAGQIDEVRVYSRALSAAELSADMSTPIGGTSTTPPPPTGDTTAPTTPDLDHRPVSSGDRRFGQPHRICRRPAGQAVPAGARGAAKPGVGVLIRFVSVG